MNLKQKSVVRRALKNDEDAISFVSDVMFIARIWDDIIDGPEPVTPNLVCKAFWKALIELQENVFYRKHQDQFVALFREYILNWMDANKYEGSDDKHLERIAFVLRDTVGGILLHCAYLIGGHDWVLQVSDDIRKVQFEESFEDYLEDLKHGTVRR